MKKRNGYSKYITYYVDEHFIDGDPTIGGLPTPGDSMWYPHLPFLWGKEPPHCNTYESVTDFDEESYAGHSLRMETVAVFSFARSRKWNIGRISLVLMNELIDENFFDYHAEQLLELFGNKNKYRTAMREIERRCGVEPGFCFRAAPHETRPRYFYLIK